MNKNKILLDIMWAIQLFFGILFWIYMIYIIVCYRSIFITHAKPLAISILAFVIIIYMIMNFDENKKSAYFIALLLMILVIIGLGCFIYYSYRVFKDLPIRSYIPAILYIFIHTFAKELKKEYIKKSKK